MEGAKSQPWADFLSWMVLRVANWHYFWRLEPKWKPFLDYANLKTERKRVGGGKNCCLWNDTVYGRPQWQSCNSKMSKRISLYHYAELINEFRFIPNHGDKLHKEARNFLKSDFHVHDHSFCLFVSSDNKKSRPLIDEIGWAWSVISAFLELDRDLFQYCIGIQNIFSICF